MNRIWENNRPSERSCLPRPRRSLGSGPIWAVLVMFCLCFSAASPAFAADPLPLDQLRRDHPRLFLNVDLLPAAKARANGPEKEFLDWLNQLGDRMIGRDVPEGDNGDEAAAMALLHVLTGRPGAFETAAEALVRSIRFYQQRDDAQQAVSWTSTTRINALCAWDWLYNELPESVRRKMGEDLLRHIDNVRPGEDRKNMGRNWSEKPGKGFYGTASLLWYAGLAFHGEGLDDPMAEKFLKRGYELYQAEFEMRKDLSGDDGGLLDYSLNYCLVMYPWAEFNFFHTMKSAFGLDEAPKWPYVPLQVNYMAWNLLPGAREFGAGDAYHDTNELPDRFLYTHLANIRHFYHQSHPDLAALAAWLQENIKTKRQAYDFPVTPFLLTGLDQSPPARSPDELRLPPARRFEALSQVFMRTGWGPDAVAAMLVTGGRSTEHKHFDENHFAIYHRGFLALDTGSRPEPGSHLFNYYCRTIAHNAMLINMPGETMPGYWGNYREFAPGEPPLSTPNDGGQSEVLGSVVKAFITQPEFTYVAGDATKAYNPEKCNLVLRQFLFIPPRYFVVFDRVESKKAEYRKTWLLHTAAEPELKDDVFRADHEDGRLFCRTILPQKAEITKIGGTRQQFMSGGRNWPLPRGYTRVKDDNPLLGQWRVEVSPEREDTVDYFLHFIEVGDRGALTAMAPSERIVSREEAGVSFTGDDGLKVQVTFAKSGSPSMHLVYESSKTKIDRVVVGEVQTQAGLAPLEAKP